MSGAAPKEIQNVSPKEIGTVVHRQEDEWRRGVVQNTQKITPLHTVEHATPSGVQPISSSPALEQVQAERIGSESSIMSDIKHEAETLGTLVGIEAPDTFHRTISGKKLFSLFRRPKKKAA